MAHIVEQLRGQYDFLVENWAGDPEDPDQGGLRVLRDAADEIERLRAALLACHRYADVRLTDDPNDGLALVVKKLASGRMKPRVGTEPEDG